ncbi:N-acetylneuraminate synthase family protein [Planktomarina temperata]|nr:N-acetylneuraminate synthase family protein [Planktomarina temperata]
MKIGNIEIGQGNVFIIAEIGNNHNGSIKMALELVDAAVEAGANCVKFQMRDMASVYRKKSLEKHGEDLGTEYVLDLLGKFQLTVEEHQEVFKYCRSKDILYMCTPWDQLSISVLKNLGVPAYKVASADLTNLPLLSDLIATGKPLILSTGMSTEAEILVTTNFLNTRKVEYVLLHCNSTYPAPFDDINLKWMKRLTEIHPLVGYSGHERGIAVSLAAVALGAKVIERHFTFDRNMEGPDHAASLEPTEFKALALGIREIEQALGDGAMRSVSQGEMINRENLAKSLVAATDLEKGTVIAAHHLKVRSPGQGLSAQYYEQLLGRTLLRSMKDEDYFYPTDLQNGRLEPRDYCFKRPWGVPVRYHDFASYEKKINPSIFEFHLSYSDLDLNLDDFLSGQYKSGFVVHAPELFLDSKLMDLATPDPEYRHNSIFETQRVINITRKLKHYFPNTPRPMIVANIGGFTMDGPLPPSEVTSYYERFSDSLSKLDLQGVELIPQTMAPFPWHFGGQRFQNLFLHQSEIVEWCEKLGLRMCFDVSHSRLMCNHFGLDFYKFAEQIAPITGHLHLGDASGTNGEGLQVGDGDIDFTHLCSILNELCPQAPFIPEIWQGHKNGGEGFWLALEKLENYLR